MQTINTMTEEELAQRFNTLVAAKLRNNPDMPRAQAEKEVNDYLIRMSAKEIAPESLEPIVEPAPEPEPPAKSYHPNKKYAGVKMGGGNKPYRPLWEVAGKRIEGPSFHIAEDAAKYRDQKLVESKGLDVVKHTLNFPEEFGLPAWTPENPKPGTKDSLSPAGLAMHDLGVIRAAPNPEIGKLIRRRRIELAILEYLPGDIAEAREILESVLKGLQGDQPTGE